MTLCGEFWSLTYLSPVYIKFWYTCTMSLEYMFSLFTRYFPTYHSLLQGLGLNSLEVLVVAGAESLCGLCWMFRSTTDGRSRRHLSANLTRLISTSLSSSETCSLSFSLKSDSINNRISNHINWTKPKPDENNGIWQNTKKYYLAIQR
mgnify:CR=1 FL=1